MVIPPSAATVTAMVADVEPAAPLTVMTAVPAETDVMAILPSVIAAVATPVLLELTLVPTKPSAAASLAVALFVCAVKPDPPAGSSSSGSIGIVSSEKVEGRSGKMAIRRLGGSHNPPPDYLSSTTPYSLMTGNNI
jgi:hypothetical protein